MEHGSPVQCILVLRGGDILTGASDGIIRCWQGYQLVSTYKGHSDTVRCSHAALLLLSWPPVARLVLCMPTISSSGRFVTGSGCD